MVSYREAERLTEVMMVEAQRRARERYPESELVQAAYVVGALRARLMAALQAGYGGDVA